VGTDRKNPEEVEQAIMRALSQRYKSSDAGGL